MGSHSVLRAFLTLQISSTEKTPIFRRRVAKRLLVVSQSSIVVVVVVRSFQLFLLLSVIITAEMDSLEFLRVP